MPKQSVYLETSVVACATSATSTDALTAARQEITRRWLDGQASNYQLFISELVVRGLTGPVDGALREWLAGIPQLAPSEEVDALAEALLVDGVIPRQAAEAATHIAVATVHGVHYLVTWDFEHIANAARRRGIERVCRSAGYAAPVICTPEQLGDATEEDEIIDEIRRIREEHAAAFDYDVRRIGDDLRRQERESGAKLVRRRPRKPRVVTPPARP